MTDRLWIDSKSEKDSVNSPSHYNSGRIEVIEAIEDWKMNYHRGNAIKYIARAGKKDPTKEAQDLEKAIWYLSREVLLVRAQGKPIPKPNMTPIASAISV